MLRKRVFKLFHLMRDLVTNCSQIGEGRARREQQRGAKEGRRVHYSLFTFVYLRYRSTVCVCVCVCAPRARPCRFGIAGVTGVQIDTRWWREGRPPLDGAIMRSRRN